MLHLSSQNTNMAIREWTFILKMETEKYFLEVKGCTLEVDGKGYFPDAPTERGSKHLMELASAIDEGYEAYLVYCIAMNGIKEVFPNETTDPKYAESLKRAVAAGVRL